MCVPLMSVREIANHSVCERDDPLCMCLIVIFHFHVSFPLLLAMSRVGANEETNA